MNLVQISLLHQTKILKHALNDPITDVRLTGIMHLMVNNYVQYPSWSHRQFRPYKGCKLHHLVPPRVCAECPFDSAKERITSR